MFSLVMIPFSKYCYCYSLAWRSFRDASPMDPVLRMDDSSNDSGVVVVAAAAAAAAVAVVELGPLAVVTAAVAGPLRPPV